jgi:neuronal growth regulator 1
MIQLIVYIMDILFVLDPPEIEVERSWVHSGEGYEAQLVCIVHADPPAAVSIFL